MGVTIEIGEIGDFFIDMAAVVVILSLAIIGFLLGLVIVFAAEPWLQLSLLITFTIFYVRYIWRRRIEEETWG